ncbi:outer membrane immunogenic protein [Methylohalomonas lacus]|uniref:Outer membrane immunogenic protein n=1 Tax=Methylohalomonas lacus TaxID=398773 RepID=A0AAE3L1H4_9GAMM|nr:outer membrane beta-barrel protein [Methylohalomonas lacus]MCS3903580.1 outer membrane immunogenic protein [Methylohalomonas lacus]
MLLFRWLTILAVSLLLAQSAYADDSFDWTGPYAGFSVGPRAEDVDWETTNYQDPDGPSIPFESNPNASLDSTDMTFNGFFGYNWLVSPKVLVGIDGNIAYADNEDTRTSIPGAHDDPPDFSFVETETDWHGSLRGRLGYLITPTIHLYTSAGLAIADTEQTAVCPADTDFCNPAFGTIQASESETMVGWTVGAGAEAAITSRLFARLDYSYADYGSLDFDGLPAISNESYGFQSKSDYTSHTVTLGLAYKF